MKSPKYSDRQEAYIIIGNDSNNNIWTYGTKTGQPFRSEESAEQRRREMERITKGKDFLVVPLSVLHIKPTADEVAL